jgi:plasmid stabilization system protein ParE
VRRAIFLASVQNDLLGILSYIAEQSGSLSVAQRFVRQLRDYCHKLAGLPGTLGRARPDIRPDLRSAPYKSYVIFFRYVGERFEVVNILEGHRDILAYFDDEVGS